MSEPLCSLCNHYPCSRCHYRTAGVMGLGHTGGWHRLLSYLLVCWLALNASAALCQKPQGSDTPCTTAHNMAQPARFSTQFNPNPPERKKKRQFLKKEKLKEHYYQVPSPSTPRSLGQDSLRFVILYSKVVNCSCSLFLLWPAPQLCFLREPLYCWNDPPLQSRGCSATGHTLCGRPDSVQAES